MANFCDNCGAKHVFFQRTCFECGYSLGGAKPHEVAKYGCLLYLIIGILVIAGIILLVS